METMKMYKIQIYTQNATTLPKYKHYHNLYNVIINPCNKTRYKKNTHKISTRKYKKIYKI